MTSHELQVCRNARELLTEFSEAAVRALLATSAPPIEGIPEEEGSLMGWLNDHGLEARVPQSAPSDTIPDEARISLELSVSGTIDLRELVTEIRSGSVTFHLDARNFDDEDGNLDHDALHSAVREFLEDDPYEILSNFETTSTETVDSDMLDYELFYSDVEYDEDEVEQAIHDYLETLEDEDE